ncbi:hypothetical protein L596_020905 [Steinernema carpocapsae]|uniref:Uncharacterized protein n=1 Tax=Steinernema carpocapsae TaxID=34508 RepID=A0A4U5MVJ3_STECR|nr:hypothetical protein L596_020905 [Steinernema carpocapsae]
MVVFDLCCESASKLHKADSWYCQTPQLILKVSRKVAVMLEEISTTNESELFTPVQRLEEEECSVPTIDLSMPFQASVRDS